jgi:hypothetical protein
MAGIDKAVQIARAYGQLTRAITERSNAERLRIAQGNYDATKAQIDAQAQQRASELSGVFQQHVGQLQANAAFRGVGAGGSTAALLASAGVEASVARKVIEINANNATGALAASSQIETEDAQLAQIQGTFQGLSIGNDFVSALASLPSSTVRQTNWVQTGLGWQPWYTYNEVPGQFNIENLFPDMGSLLEE